MATIQGLTLPASAIIDGIKLRSAHLMLKVLYARRSRLILSLLKAGTMHCTEIERALYKAGDIHATQSQVSQSMQTLKKYGLIRRVYSKTDLPKFKYYALDEKRILWLNDITHRFSNNSNQSL